MSTGEIAMSPELLALVLSATLTGVIWVPIILNRLREMGIWKALSNPEPDLRPHAEWAYRLGHAHRNAIENLVVFAPLALAVHFQGIGNTLTAAWATAFVAARAAHVVIYTFGIPLLRTIAFFAGFLAQMVFAMRLLGVI